MRITNRLAFAVALAGLLQACGPKVQLQKFDEETLAVDPRANFVLGVQTLENPNAKTGLVDYDAAYKYFRDAATLGGGAKAHFNTGWVAEVLERPDDALTHYQKAYEADPTYLSALHSLARVLVELERAPEAVELYQAYTASNPDDLAVRGDLVLALGAAGQLDAALEEAQGILLVDPKNVQVYRNLATIYHDAGNYGMARLCSEKALQIEAEDSGTYNNLGVTYLAQGDAAAAIEHFKRAVELDPSSFEGNANLGYIALDSGDYGLARTSFQQALQGSPDSLEAKLGLAVSLRGEKSYDEAGGLYDDIIKAEPGFEIAYFNAATLHEKYTRDYTKALKYLEAFIAQAGTLPADHEVYALVEAVQASKAEEEARKAAEAERKRAEAEREKRNKELLAALEGKLDALETKIGSNTDCLGEEVAMEVQMFIETAREGVIATGDTAMAPDIESMLTDYYGPMVDTGLEACGGAPGTPSDAEGAGDAEGSGDADGAE